MRFSVMSVIPCKRKLEIWHKKIRPDDVKCVWEEKWLVEEKQQVFCKLSIFSPMQEMEINVYIKYKQFTKHLQNSCKASKFLHCGYKPPTRKGADMLKIAPIRKSPDYQEIYFNLFQRRLAKYAEDRNDRFALRQLVFAGVRWLNCCAEKPEDPDAAAARMSMYQVVNGLIGLLTPAELVTVFPVDKTFDGDRWEIKDYFFTMDELRKIGMDAPIGTEQVTGLLWDYENGELREYLVRYMSTMSAVMEFQGKPSLFEQMTEHLGLETYALHRDPVTHQQYMQNSHTGAVTPVQTGPRLRLVQ